MAITGRMRRARQLLVDRTIAAGARVGGMLPDALMGLTVREAVLASRLSLIPIFTAIS